MTLRRKVAGSYWRSLPLARLYLDDLECITELMKMAGDVEIIVGKDDAFGERGSVADSVRDLVGALPKDRRYLNIRASPADLDAHSGAIWLTLNWRYASVFTSGSSSEARVRVDEIAEYIERRRRPLVAFAVKFGYILASPITSADIILSQSSSALILILISVLSILGLLSIAFTILGPRGAQIVARERHDAVSSGAQTWRDLIVGTVTGIPAAIIGVVIGFLLGRK